MKHLCNRAKVICSKKLYDAEIDADKTAQYKRIISLLKKLSKDVKEDNLQYYDDGDERSLENLATNKAA